MNNYDIIVGLQYGDEGKGKVTHHLLKNGNYTECMRYNGGGNAGHTIYHNDKKYVTHLIPAGIFYENIPSIIGPGCVINMKRLKEETVSLREAGFTGKIMLCENVHLVTSKHIEEDSRDTKIGTTKTGNGPAYSDKYKRVGARVNKNSNYNTIDLYNYFNDGKTHNVLCEGAQGMWLDIICGDYPYVTSSHCTAAGALINGFSHKEVGIVWGVAKAYDTYVGARTFEPDKIIFDKLREAGQEYGATTGRNRQCNWLNLDRLIKAININGADCIIINKIDILREIDRWSLYINDQEIDLKKEYRFKLFIFNHIMNNSNHKIKNIYFADNPYNIGKPFKNNSLVNL